MTRTKDSTAVQARHDASSEDLHIVQEHRDDAPAGWVEVQDSIASAAGLALLLVDGRQPPALAISNNNSICHAFQSSTEHVTLCDPYCGDAHRRAMSAGARVDYKCHAGLQCFTMPVQIGTARNLAVIGGRAFVSGADYRALAERFRGGELNELIERDPFSNVIFAEPERMDQLAQRVVKAETRTVSEIRKPVVTAQPAPTKISDNLAIASTSLQEEVDRLRVELEYRSQLAESLQTFLHRISSTDPEMTYRSILAHVRELLQAERASLWVFDENSNDIILRAAVGLSVDIGEVGRKRLGEGITGKVFESGEPLVVANIKDSEFTPAPPEHRYRTTSFLSYPVAIGGRKIGLVHISDKRDGTNFNDVDLSLLEIIGPQIAVALERAEWQERAAQFQLMSITDPLTGLLNRRYLEERLAEELSRSKRYTYSMSCLMIDIDDFKKYNDRNGHQAGDVALKITAHNLKAALRSDDIACRYGGEEFCILLPQTTMTEAAVIAERMRQRVAEADYPYGKSQPLGRVSISIGISTLGKNVDTSESVIAAADRALYNAKSLGKDRIEFYSDVPSVTDQTR